MKLFHSSASPFVRKVMVVAHEHGLADRIEKLPAAAGPVARDPNIRPVNPAGQVPTFITDAGEALYDSRVICEYLDALGGGRLFPSGPERWGVLTQASMGDSIMDAALLARYETFLRPEPFSWAEWAAGQLEKVTDGLALVEKLAPVFGGRVDIGTITIGCALGYLDFRFPDLGWRASHPAAAAWFGAFDSRPAMAATRPG